MSDVVFAFGFHAVIDRGRGLYGSTVFTIIVATIALLFASGALLATLDEEKAATRAAIRDAALSEAPVRKPILFFPLLMAFLFAVFVWIWATDRYPPQPTQVAIPVLWLGYTIGQYIYERRRWLRARAGILPRKVGPLMEYFGPSVLITILVLTDWNGRRFLPGWFSGFTVLVCLLLVVGIARAFVKTRTPSRT